MKDTVTYTVTKGSVRLDKSLTDNVDDLSRSRAKSLIEDGLVLVDGQKKKAKYDVKDGEVIQVTIPEPETMNVEPENIDIDIVYEDDDVIVVNKPQGMVVHPSPGHPDHTLVNALLYHSPLSTINGTYRPGIVHRIDKDTSGLLMVAKNNYAHESLSKQLKDKSNIREYIALVHGNIKENSGVINAPIGRSKKDRKKQAIVDDGKNAVTHFKVLERFGGEYTLVSCVLETGRTHQIRVHMKYIGHPLAGDPLYGPKNTLKGNGQFLHAKKLGFVHPKTNEQMIFETPLPEIFEQTITKLRNKYNQK
ncbi:RluA family pseudouridine synthase [Apilactobacillus kunkeei]|uniref:Pseudouridine synthase n=1 Tax=Apilactobacillus waqarii TaxID=2851006 RepID=A0ABS6M2P9_9LACO|nr:MULTISPECIES: RluA family pseudouridine synthase [Apilactobacillus]MBI0090816.1 RluA family pseudouridine synthase [Lactobacillus sp. M0345]MBV0914472.1 RluA family pseudouridine synthase [Apilactobacillus waqarii]KIM19071.1 pseudouridine synthase [Apilactobacillus kunkeei]MBX8455542.1 RluA family pseudouridine synthase [Apilactobacillus kunkeei]MCK8618237.1 RluA family pseudouridine synthase [Apilactobacillus kunkeei]